MGMADPEVRVTKNAAKGHKRAYGVLMTMMIVFEYYWSVCGERTVVQRQLIVVRVLKHTDRTRTTRDGRYVSAEDPRVAAERKSSRRPAGRRRRRRTSSRMRTLPTTVAAAAAPIPASAARAEFRKNRNGFSHTHARIKPGIENITNTARPVVTHSVPAPRSPWHLPQLSAARGSVCRRRRRHNAQRHGILCAYSYAYYIGLNSTYKYFYLSLLTSEA